MAVRVRGGAALMRNLNIQIKAVENRSMRGLFAAGLLVKNRAVKLTPWDTGNLAGSAYVQPASSSQGPAVEVGYTAAYAPFVHEMPSSFNFTKAGTGPKFLEKAIRKSQKEIIMLIQRAAMIK
jgi:hypothetical protein